MNAPSRLEPSTIAASSSSFGTPRMNPRSVQTANGSRNVMYVRISPASAPVGSGFSWSVSP